jgi:hypothetical protein
VCKDMGEVLNLLNKGEIWVKLGYKS